MFYNEADALFVQSLYLFGDGVVAFVHFISKVHVIEVTTPVTKVWRNHKQRFFIFSQISS